MPAAPPAARTLRRSGLLAFLLVAVAGSALLGSVLLGSALLGGATPARASAPAASAWQAGAPADTSKPASLSQAQRRWVERQMERLSLAEKVSQMFSVWVSGYFQPTGDASVRDVARLIEDFGLGSVSFGRGAPMAQAALANDLQRRAELPLLVSQDMEWGPGMRLERASTFPRAMAVGATRDPTLARRAGRITGREARALGVQHVFAPVADVNNNPLNPVIGTRSFGEDPQLVARMVRAFVNGVQEGGAIATAKHFPGHGDTSVDSHLGLPVLDISSRARLDTLELVPFRAAIDAGVSSVMTGHLALPALQPDRRRRGADPRRVPATLSPRLTDQLLREDLGFEGLVVTDALTMSGITEGFGAGEAAIRAIEAGADVLLKSEDFYAARHAVLEAVSEGRLGRARIDRSVRRVLRAKAQMGLPQRRLVDLAAVRERVGAPEDQLLGDAIARQSLTLLRNEEGLFPMTPVSAPERVLVVVLSDSSDRSTGRAFRQVLQRGVPAGTELTVRTLDARSDSSDFAAVRAEATAYDAVLAPAFLRVRSGGGRIRLPEAQRAFLNGLVEAEVPVVLVSFGNVYGAAGLQAQPAAYLATYGTEAATQRAAAQAVLGKSPTPGKLPVTVPGAYDYGAGIPLEQVAPRRDAPRVAGLHPRRLSRTDSLVRASIRERAFPGAALAVGRGKTVAKMQGYGYQTYALDEPVTPRSRFDLASLTKVVATTPAAMKLYEEGRLSLGDRVASHLPAFAQNGKGDVTIRQLLTHSSGLKAYLGPEERGDTRGSIEEAVMAQPLQYEPGTKSMYSGLGMIALQLVIEKITGQSLAAYAEEHVFEPLGMAHTGFRAAGATGDSSFVPTADGEDTFYGRVHDPLARQMGGTSGNAGLFSTAEDLSKFGYMLVNEGRIYGKQFLEAETIETFTERAEGLGGTRALGWDTKTMGAGYSSAGSRFGPESFGHTGFTGTSLWVDPEQDLFALLLTNRVYPRGGANDKITAVRPALHDLVYQALVENGRPNSGRARSR
ncbi:MAG: beta-N-acetylglucosaminidase [Bacteroidetes bacterium QS_9_68_14]|nr:MAG: beta-N-acetylglucosaminidase [Bacteroidetes bacterium QS_9_68_14]